MEGMDKLIMEILNFDIDLTPVNPLLSFLKPTDAGNGILTESTDQTPAPEGSIPASYPEIVALEWSFISVPWAMSTPAILFEDYGRKAILVIPRKICSKPRVGDGEVKSTFAWFRS